ncbi:hypothetical protein BURK2_03346 [Burkholderiales bacterium]|nr:MAG: alpha/beta hydrolase [Burkholderiales bacterium]CAG1005010.1 hypothetical protein BURK2_03346 [Burkholderiales bacterium]
MSDQPIWILLRGLTRESGHWGAFLPQLAAALPGAHILTIDLPGNGALFTEASPWTVAAMARHCRAQLVAQQIAPPYHLLALSLGGMVAVAWSEQAPRELARMVLVNTSMRPFSPFYHRLRPAAYAPLLRGLLGLSTPEQWEAAVLRLTCNAPHPGILDDWLRLHRTHPVAPRSALAQILAASRFRAPRAAPPVPTLVVASREDRLVNVACSHALASAWQCPLEVHPSAGHDLPLDDGVWLAARVAGFVVR